MIKQMCPSTHGGSGWPRGSYQRSDGMVVCGACGAACPPTPFTPSWVGKGISFEKNEEQRKQAYLKSLGPIDRFLRWLFRYNDW